MSSRIFRFLAKVRDAIRMATWTRRIRRFLLNNGAASPSRPCAGKYGKTSNPPRFTNFGQEPTLLTKHTDDGERGGVGGPGGDVCRLPRLARRTMGSRMARRTGAGRYDDADTRRELWRGWRLSRP